MPRFRAGDALSIACALVFAGGARAQFGRGAPEWMTDGGDAQRSSWIRSDPKISVESVGKPGFQAVWKIKLDHEPGPVATLDRYIGYRGFRSLALMVSASGDVTAIDTDLGRIEWKKSLGMSAHSGSGPCSAGMMAEAVRPTGAAYPGAPAGRGGGMLGRSGPAKSGVGQPGEGAVTITEIAARAGANPAGGRGAAGRGGPAMPPGFGRMATLLDMLSRDGALHAMYISNGEEPSPGVPFLPADTNGHGLAVIDNVAYAATSGGCGGAPNGIWALDLASKQVAHWTPGSDVAGRAGFAFGPDRTVYATTSGGELVALDAKTLQVKATYSAGGQAFTSSPVVFEQQSKSYVAAATKDGRVHLVDGVSMSGAAYPGVASGDLASWQDSGGTRWILAPSKDAIASWKIAGDGTPILQPGWTSREMDSPMAPVVINGVVFAVSNASSPVLYAFDGSSGKELWNSGKTITAPVRTGMLSGSGSQLYLGTSDGTIYAFGFPIEH